MEPSCYVRAQQAGKIICDDGSEHEYYVANNNPHLAKNFIIFVFPAIVDANTYFRGSYSTTPTTGMYVVDEHTPRIPVGFKFGYRSVPQKRTVRFSVALALTPGTAFNNFYRLVKFGFAINARVEGGT